MRGARSRVRGGNSRKGQVRDRDFRADVIQTAASLTTSMDRRGQVHDAAAEGNWVSRYQLERRMQAGLLGVD